MKYLFLSLLALPLLGQGQYTDNFDSFDGSNEWTSPGGNTGSHNGYLCINTTGTYSDNTEYIFESPESCVDDYSFEISFDVRNNKDFIYIEGFDGTSWSTLHTYTQSGFGTVSGNYMGLKVRIRIVTGSGGNTNGKYVHVDYFTVGCSPLPVELVEFISLGNVVKWTTASELNSERFILEYSYDGESWNYLEEKTGNGTTSDFNEYEVYDNIDHKSTVYYRLTQYDYNGDSEVFGPISRHIETDKFLVKEVNISGVEVDRSVGGFILQIWSDGSVTKLFR